MDENQAPKTRCNGDGRVFVIALLTSIIVLMVYHVGGQVLCLLRQSCCPKAPAQPQCVVFCPQACPAGMPQFGPQGGPRFRPMPNGQLPRRPMMPKGRPAPHGFHKRGGAQLPPAPAPDAPAPAVDAEAPAPAAE